MVKRFEASVDRLYVKLDGLYHKYHVVFDVFFFFCLIMFFIIALLCDGEKTIRTKVLLKPFVKQFTKILDWYLLPALAGVTLLFDYKDKKNRLIVFFVLYILMLYQLTADEHIVAIIPHCNIFYFGGACLVVAAKGRDFKKIAWTYVITASAFMITVTILALTGVVNDVLETVTWRTDRHSFGVNYPINYAGHWLAILLVLCYVKDGFLKIWDYLLQIVLIGVSLLYCKAQTSTILMILLFMGTLYRQICYKKGKQRLFKDKKITGLFVLFIEWSYIIFAAFMIIGAFLYVPPISTFVQNSILFTFGDRLQYGRYGLVHFFPTLLGVNYTAAIPGAPYFFIDCSYITVLLKCGVVTFGIVMAGLWYRNRRLAKAGQIYVLCLLFLFALDCTMEPHLMEVAFNPFWMMMFAVISPAETKKLDILN